MKIWAYVFAGLAAVAIISMIVLGYEKGRAVAAAFSGAVAAAFAIATVVREHNEATENLHKINKEQMGRDSEQKIILRTLDAHRTEIEELKAKISKVALSGLR